jgi:hypothetical protein
MWLNLEIDYDGLCRLFSTYLLTIYACPWNSLAVTWDLRFSWQWRCHCWSSGLQHHVDLSPEDGGSIVLWNVIYLNSTQLTTQKMNMDTIPWYCVTCALDTNIWELVTLIHNFTLCGAMFSLCGECSVFRRDCCDTFWMFAVLTLIHSLSPLPIQINSVSFNNV